MINIAGLICLFYYGFLYVVHDQGIMNPDGMLMLERWDAGGMALTIGLIPLIIANSLACDMLHGDQRKVGLYCFLPSLICALIVAHYWITSLLF